jgi:hypothetical protein
MAFGFFDGGLEGLGRLTASDGTAHERVEPFAQRGPFGLRLP